MIRAAGLTVEHIMIGLAGRGPFIARS